MASSLTNTGTTLPCHVFIYNKLIQILKELRVVRFVYVLHAHINIYIIGTLISFFDKSYIKCPFILTFSLLSTTTHFEELIVFVLVMWYLRT
jgi:hypothetical protein